MTATLSSFYRADEKEIRDYLLDYLPWGQDRADTVRRNAIELVKETRAKKLPTASLDAFMKEYSLDKKEGLALMTLAEALLRVPDKTTRNALIRDKVRAANWLDAIGGSKDWVVKAAGAGLMMTSKSLNSALKYMAQPVIREAMVHAMQVLGRQFVLGETIEQAYVNAENSVRAGYRMSFDMLGEGARTARTAEEYFNSYHEAITEIARAKGRYKSGLQHGVSVKLSALHPRYEFAHKETCVPEITNSLRKLCLHASSLDIPLTVDAEETERLEMSLDIIESMMKDTMLENWDGFGLAVQAYQKRAPKVIEKLCEWAALYGRKIHIRLVKGAYWDREIKYAQVHGYDDFPVFTRKSNTDLCYLACTYQLLKNADNVTPMLAGHNAHTIAAVIHMAEELGVTNFELQRLHGMGENLYACVKEKWPDVKTSIYAPVGPQADLLPYLVRRLLENGANSSFVNRLLDDKIHPREVVRDPVARAAEHDTARHPKILMPRDLFKPERENSAGYDLEENKSVQLLYNNIDPYMDRHYTAAPIINGEDIKYTAAQDIHSPRDKSDHVGCVHPANRRIIEQAFDHAQTGFESWSATSGHHRADILEKLADLLEENSAEISALGIREAGKTIPDLHDEIREAVDFCRYYAAHGRILFDHEPQRLPGPDGEKNRYMLTGRGIFICVSPWNFPVAIFTGQIVAALMAGNAVLAKPAEQTPLLASYVVKLMHKAGIPENVLHLLPGDGEIGGALIGQDQVAGVAFTGSTGTAKTIQRALAAKNGPIVPLIAETGGQNAMIVDSSALPEQVVDDVILSAFGSAGQRCSALRVLYLQEDIADNVIEMIKGAMAELKIGDTYHLSADLGPVIDESAHASLSKHIKELDGFASFIARADLDDITAAKGHYLAPCAYEIGSIKDLSQEHFGPILHVVRYAAKDIDDVLADIRAAGFGLTLGIHSRIEEFQQKIIKAMPIGNIYINRGMTGAIVGSQPFGGMGLSGTGPKAGGPYYLKAFAGEKVLSIDTTAAGGNASLVSLAE